MSLEPPNIGTEEESLPLFIASQQHIITTILSPVSISLSFASFTYIYLYRFLFPHTILTYSVYERSLLLLTIICDLLIGSVSGTTSPGIGSRRKGHRDRNGQTGKPTHNNTTTRPVLDQQKVQSAVASPSRNFITGAHRLRQVESTRCWPLNTKRECEIPFFLNPRCVVGIQARDTDQVATRSALSAIRILPPAHLRQ